MLEVDGDAEKVTDAALPSRVHEASEVLIVGFEIDSIEVAV
jgi:hypothetical protein